jgi:hypothetical protein
MDSVETLQEELKEHQFRGLHIPTLILNLIKSGEWKHRDPAPKRLEPKEFYYFPNFVEEVRPWGLQTSFREIEAICAGYNEVEIELGKQKSIQLEMDIDVKRIRKTEKQKHLEVLEHYRPDLFEKVINRELSVYSAMLEAGFKKRQIRLQKTPTSFGNYIRSNFSQEEKKELIKLLSE